MRPHFTASSLAFGLAASLIMSPVANAADIGEKNSEGECTVALTDLERSHLFKRKDEIAPIELVTAVVEAFEATYPGFDVLGAKFVKNPELRGAAAELEAGRTLSEQRTESLQKVWADEHQQFASEDEWNIYSTYLEIRLLQDFPGLVRGMKDFDLGKKIEFNKVDVLDGDWGVPDAAAEMIDVLRVPDSEADEFRTAFSRTEYGRKWREIEKDYYRAMQSAERICKAGGGAVVDFPVDEPTVAPSAETERPAPNPDYQITDNGSSEDTGKIIGIIAGVLVALGLIAGGVVAFAPQLGITLPF